MNEQFYISNKINGKFKPSDHHNERNSTFLYVKIEIITLKFLIMFELRAGVPTSATLVNIPIMKQRKR